MLRFWRVADRRPEASLPADALRLRLTFDERVRSRLATMTEDGVAVAITLPRGTVLRDGATLAGDDGAIAVVEAAPQPLARVTAGTTLQLLRVVYHLANRHVPAQITDSALLIERDPVLERMALGLGARVEHVQLPFDPEAGAYVGAGHAHSHGIEPDDPARHVGEELSIAAHRAPGGASR
jgi:urease accessory protein